MVPPPWGLDTPPLGLAYLSAALAESGREAFVFDGCQDIYRACDRERRRHFEFAAKDLWNDEAAFAGIYAELADQFRAYLKEIMACRPDLIGFSVNQNNRLCAGAMARELRRMRPELTLVAGGAGVYSEFERRTFKDDCPFDLFVVGEGEEPLVEIAARLEEGRGLFPGPGLARLDEPVRPHYHRNLDLLPRPGFEEFRLENYSRCLPLLLTRGCTGRCVFCNDRVLTGPYRQRDPVAVAREMAAHFRRFGVYSFIFNDLAINCNPDLLRGFLPELISQNLDLVWGANAIPKVELDDRMLSQLRAAGCRELTFGVESGSDTVLGLMGKKFSSSQAVEVLARVRGHGITAWVNLIVGFPGETEADFQQTLDLLDRVSGSVAGIGSLNTCNVAFNSILRRERERFRVIASSAPEVAETGWRLQDGSNTLEIRRERLGRLSDKIRRLGLPIRQTNLFGE